MTLIFLFYLLLYISETKGKCSFAKFMRGPLVSGQGLVICLCCEVRVPIQTRMYAMNAEAIFPCPVPFLYLWRNHFFFLLPHLQFCQKNFFPVFSFFPSFDAKVKCANIGTRDAIERQIIVDKSLNLIGNSKIFYLSKKSNQM